MMAAARSILVENRLDQPFFQKKKKKKKLEKEKTGEGIS